MKSRVDAAVVSGLAVVLIGSLFSDWVYVTGIDDGDVVGGTESTWIWFPVALAILSLIGAGILHQVGQASVARIVQSAGAGILFIPAGFIVIVTEVVQAALPTWLAPVLTNSDVFAFRAGVGAWMGLVIAIALVVIAIIGLPASDDDSERGFRAYSATLAMLVGSTGLMVLRARPFAKVELEVSDEGLTSTAGSLAEQVGEPEVAQVGEQVADAVSGEITINLVAGDIPLFGQVTLFATVGLVIALVVLLIRPRLGSVVVAATMSGVLMFSAWLLSAIVVIIDTVIPDSWLAIDGYAAASASPTTSVWWTLMWSSIFVAGTSSLALVIADDAPVRDVTGSDPEPPWPEVPTVDWGSN